jgi:hypothetical protein
MCDELSIRCEIMALWAGKGKTIARVNTLKFKSFIVLKNYRSWKKHSQQMLKHKIKEHRETVKRNVFLCWEKHYKAWKI